MSDFISSIANSINYKYTSNLGWFQFGGISSGLDTASIIEKILEFEGRPLQNLNLKYEKLKLQRKAFEEIDSKLEELRDLIFELRLKSNVMLKSATSSNESLLTASASSSAINGTFYVKVLSLSTSSILQGYEIKDENFSTSKTYGELTYYTTPEDSQIKIYVYDTSDPQNHSETELTISTGDTIEDILNNIQQAIAGVAPNAEVSIDSSGKLVIDTKDSTKVVSITQLSGNFLTVFHLDEAPASGSRIEGSAPIWALSTSQTLEYIGNMEGLTLNDTGTIVINGVSISLNKTDTLADVISKINSSDANVYAYFDYHTNTLTLTRKDTGNQPIDVQEGDGGNFGKVLGLVSNNSDYPIFTPGHGAHVQISYDGVNFTDVYSNSNQVEYQGVTLNLKNADPNQTVIVSVSTDTEGIKNKIKEFVDKWNEVLGYIYSKLNEEPVKDKDWNEMSDEEKMKGILRNDQYLRGLFERIKEYMIDSFNASGEIHHLFEIGVSSGDVGGGYENMMKGHLEIDEEKLDEVINNNFDELWEFLGGADDAFFERLHDFLWDVTKFGGEIDSVAGINGRLYREQRYLADQIADWVRRLQKREEELWQKFSYMEQVISRFQAQSAWLAQFTAARQK